MAQLKSLICKGCGAAIGLDQLERCPYCKKQNFVMGSIDPLTMESQKVQEMITFYKGKIESNSKDTNSLFALGLFYLALNNYRFAQQNFLKAIELSPMESDVYYYYALSLIAGRSSKNLDHNEAIEIEEMINTAVKMQRKRKYLALLACIEQGAFVSNGLQAKENPSELIQEALKIMPEAGELEEIAKHAQPNDKESKNYLAMLATGKKGEAVDTNSDTDTDIGGINNTKIYYPLPNDEKFSQKGYNELVKAERNRQDFFTYMEKPLLPQHEKKPFYPIWRIIKSWFFAFVLFIVVAVVASIKGLGDGIEDEREFVAIGTNTPDSVLVQDSSFVADHWIFRYKIKNSDGEYDKSINGLPDESVQRPYLLIGSNYSKKTFIYLLVIFSPFLICFLLTSWFIWSRYRERSAIGRHNKELDKKYNMDMERFENRPTIKDYLVFCRDYLGKGKIAYGDVVTQVLKQYDISELNVVGKILFVNFFDYDENRTYNEDNEFDLALNPDLTEDANDVLDRIYYTIAIPQKDHLLIVNNFWDTVKNKQTTPQVRSIFYGNISEVQINPVSNQLEIHTNREGVISIVLPPEQRSNVLNYQCSNVKSSLDYSITRTGNVYEFFNALSTLIRTYQK